MTHKELREHIQKRTAKGRKTQDALKELSILESAEPGFLEAEHTPSAWEVEEVVDIGTKEKALKLDLEEGRYRCAYTDSGRHLLLHSAKGFVSMIDTISMNCLFERNLQDEVRASTFLASEGSFALAQPKATYIYNKEGVEVHAVRYLHGVNAMVYLPHHFLLATASEKGILQYQDISMGKLVSDIKTREGPQHVIEHDSSNGVVYLSGRTGTVSLWAPRSSEYLAKILCHRNKVEQIKIRDGIMATVARENKLKLWDMRATHAPLLNESVPFVPREIDFSQNRKIALCSNSKSLVYDVSGSPYMKHTFSGRQISHCRFVPYEDILTVCTNRGVDSMVVPGSGAALYEKYDNPRMSKGERREAEVRRLLEKIPADMIGLESGVGEIHKELFREEEFRPKREETSADKIRRLMKRYYS
jgi:U3 small nucleolar RNA-associated protein 7